MVSENELLTRATEADEEALSELLMRHGPAVRRRIERSIASKWRSVLEADDVMQVTYLEAFLRITHFVPSGDGSFERWIRRIAENNLRDAARELGSQKRPQPDRRVEELPDRAASCIALLEQIGCTTTTPSRHASNDEMRVAVEDYVERLPADYASVIREYDLDGRAIEAVAESLGRSVGAVYMLRARAHDRLKEMIGSGTQFFTNPS